MSLTLTCQNLNVLNLLLTTVGHFRDDNHGLNPDDIAAYKRKKAEKKA